MKNIQNIHPCQTIKLFCEIQDSALQKMPLASGVRGIDYLNNLTAFQDLVSKTQVMKCRLFSGIFSAILSVLLIHSFPSRDNFHKIQNDSKKIMQTDANLVDCVGGSRPVHRSLLRVKFPVLRDLKDFDAVILDGVTPEEVDLLVELTYGMNRLHSIHVFVKLTLESSSGPSLLIIASLRSSSAQLKPLA